MHHNRYLQSHPAVGTPINLLPRLIISGPFLHPPVMSHPFPLRSIPADGTSPAFPTNPNLTSSNNNLKAMRQQWEEAARVWLSSLPDRRDPSASEMDVWIDSNYSSIPNDIRSLPRSDLYQRILSLSFALPVHSQAARMGRAEFPYRFQRTDQWRPVYSWLESMDKDMIVNSKEITEWLSLNTEFRDKLLARHSKYHLMHYIQKLHLKLLKKKGKLPKGMLLSAARASVKSANGGVKFRDDNSLCKASADTLKDDGVFQSRRNDAFLRYELLTDLQEQLTSILKKHNENSSSIKDYKPSFNNQKQDYTSNQRNEGDIIVSKAASSSLDVAINSVSEPTVDAHVLMPTNCITKTIEGMDIDGTRISNSKPAADMNIGQKRRRDPIIATPAWSCSEASSVVNQINTSSCSHSEEARKDSASFRRSSCNKNIAMCFVGREIGINWPLCRSPGGYAERNQRRWIPLFEGWQSLECQFEGPAVLLKRKIYSSWAPTWCAYTSSVAIAQPHGRQGVQKVLDVRFHPEGLPQLICSSNEGPNELLLYNLLSGRAIQLTGHGCQIQAVEFAVRGASIVSCGSNLMKVWDCTTGSCLFTLGSPVNDQAVVGHTQKINTMTVNKWQSCLVVTGGGMGDGKLLLWNALRGELVADLNANLRVKNHDLSSINTTEFCNETLLACGSDFDCGGSSAVQLWDIESPQSLQCFTANDSFITSLKVNPQGSTIITGAVNGTVGLLDIRTCNAINYLSVGSSYEVTSVSFSSCGKYFSASSTSNNTLVWDTRLVPTSVRDTFSGNGFSARDLRLIRPLHCLSHGKQMPTAEHTGQLPGHVDEGYQGVNDARWLQRESVLITASGDGSVAMWDVNLGKPCVRHLASHSRCVNTIAVAPNDDYICSGGDDQKVVLYHNNRGRTRQKWRLTHPLSRKAQQDK
ncbi:uncharacterized protein LOC110029125 [Phalaenopsis equestris]|uniref:uncharacterized protein LOC110029125 n=1 Tax=Phalaenopsis equestris TaxID=78828 RepID=UPI0009E35C88|nr:uncharacterized protein LOC110029125 [Phalaenopsis equestris]